MEAALSRHRQAASTSASPGAGAASGGRRLCCRTGLELCKTAELFKTAVDLSARQRAEPLHAETLATIAAHDGSVDHGPVQDSGIEVFVFEVKSALGEIADESSGEAVAGAGGIEHIIQQISGDDEVGVAPEQNGAVLSTFDHNRAGTHLEDLAGSLLQIMLA